MADSVREDIIQYLETTLKAITGVKRVERYRLDGLSQRGKYPAICLINYNEVYTKIANDAFQSDMGLTIEIWRQFNKKEYLDEQLNILTDLVTEALMADITCNRKAHFIMPKSREIKIDSETDRGVCMLDITIRYVFNPKNAEDQQ